MTHDPLRARCSGEVVGACERCGNSPLSRTSVVCLCGGGKLQENPCLGLWPLAGGFPSKGQDGKYVSFDYWTHAFFGGEMKF